MKAVGLRGAVAVFDAVKPGQVGAGLRRGDDIVGRDHIVHHTQLEKFDNRAVSAQEVNRVHHGFFHIRIKVFCEIQIFLWNADADAVKIAFQGIQEIFRLSLHGGGILGVIAHDHIQKNRAVRRISCHRSDLIQRGGIGNQAITGNGSVGRFDARNAAVSGGLTDGTAGVGTQGRKGFSCRYSRTGTT